MRIHKNYTHILSKKTVQWLHRIYPPPKTNFPALRDGNVHNLEKIQLPENLPKYAYFGAFGVLLKIKFSTQLKLCKSSFIPKKPPKKVSPARHLLKKNRHHNGAIEKTSHRCGILPNSAYVFLPDLGEMVKTKAIQNDLSFVYHPWKLTCHFLTTKTACPSMKIYR